MLSAHKTEIHTLENFHKLENQEGAVVKLGISCLPQNYN